MRAVRVLPWLQGGFVGLVLVAHFAIHVMAGQWALSSTRAAMLVMDAATIAKAALLALWLGWGPGRLWLRCVVVAGVLGLFWPTGSRLFIYRFLFHGLNGQFGAVGYNYVPATLFSRIAGLQAALLLGVAIVLRIQGRQLVRVGAFEPSPPPFQFSLRTLLVLVTVVAIVARWAISVRTAPEFLWRVPALAGVVFAAVPTSLVALLATWAMLWPGPPWRRLTAMALTAPALGLVIPQTCGHEENLAMWAAFTSINGALVAGPLFAARLAGFRVVSSPFHLPSSNRSGACPITAPLPSRLDAILPGSASP